MKRFSQHKTGLTMKRHKEIGERLKSMQREMDHLRSELFSAYPTTSTRHARLAMGAVNSMAGMGGNLSKLRCHLEELMATQHPDEWTTSVYYGGEEAAAPKENV